MDVGPHLAMFQLSVNPSCEVFFVLGDFFLPREELCWTTQCSHSQAILNKKTEECRLLSYPPFETDWNFSVSISVPWTSGVFACDLEWGGEWLKFTWKWLIRETRLQKAFVKCHLRLANLARKLSRWRLRKKLRVTGEWLVNTQSLYPTLSFSAQNRFPISISRCAKKVFFSSATLQGFPLSVCSFGCVWENQAFTAK